jgi:hypothetical protein
LAGYPGTVGPAWGPPSSQKSGSRIRTGVQPASARVRTSVQPAPARVWAGLQPAPARVRTGVQPAAARVRTVGLCGCWEPEPDPEEGSSLVTKQQDLLQVGNTPNIAGRHFLANLMSLNINNCLHLPKVNSVKCLSLHQQS